MSDQVVIQVHDLWKKYRLGMISTGTVAHDLNRWWARVRGKPDPYAKVGEAGGQSSVGSNQATEEGRKRSVASSQSSVQSCKPPTDDCQLPTANCQLSADNSVPPTDDRPLPTANCPLPTPASSLSEDEIWALRGVSFEVKQGEILGIIGRNGAGKSTLLKILSRTTAPTSGEVRIKGRIASLLEVGTGFHPELTGRENVFLNGAILGMTKAEIRKKFDEIVAFSEVEKFIDTPVKRYSSGMYVRLAFAVAAHLEPEILIVDEVLAVGDAQFQKKCLGKMQDVAGHGRTVLFVSHNMPAIRTLCSSALLVEAGELHFNGDTASAVDQYLGCAEDASLERRWEKGSASSDEVLRLRGVSIRGGERKRDYLAIEEDLFLDVEYEVLQAHPRVCVSIHLLSQGVCAFVGGNTSSAHGLGIFRATCRIPAHLLNNIHYSVTVFLITNTTELRVIERDALSFVIQETDARGEYVGSIAGLVRPRLDWSAVNLSSPQKEPVS